MNKLLIAATAVLAISAGSAMAADLTDKLAWNTELTTTYDVSNELFGTDFETGLAFQATADLSAYGTLYADVKAGEFTGSEFGVVYAPSQLKYLTATTYMTLDNNFEKEQAFVELSVKF
jgi:hypothetical protein